jgi:hypothetical protein
VTGSIILANGRLTLYLDPEPKKKAKLWPILFSFILGLWADALLHDYPKEDAMKTYKIREGAVYMANNLIKGHRKDFAKSATLRNSYLGVSMSFREGDL